MKPFWTYFGGKYRLAPRYPKPLHKRIVEPFAGAAGYSLRYHEHDVTLVEKDPMIAGIWRYLIAVTAKEIRQLPLLPTSGRLDDAVWPCEEAKHLAGFWITRGAAHPNRTASAWMRDPRYSQWSWGEMSRERIASQVDRIRHWRIIEGSFEEAPQDCATWFIDPPYIKAGTRYRYGSQKIDFGALAIWCTARDGQTIVCEQSGASWLPFKHFYEAKANQKINGK